MLQFFLDFQDDASNIKVCCRNFAPTVFEAIWPFSEYYFCFYLETNKSYLYKSWLSLVIIILKSAVVFVHSCICMHHGAYAWAVVHMHALQLYQLTLASKSVCVCERVWVSLYISLSLSPLTICLPVFVCPCLSLSLFSLCLCLYVSLSQAALSFHISRYLSLFISLSQLFMWINMLRSVFVISVRDLLQDQRFESSTLGSLCD